MAQDPVGTEASPLEAELATISAELLALPLSNENRGRRLALNGRRLELEGALRAVAEQRRSLERLAEIDRLSHRLTELGPGSEDRAARRAIRQRLAELKAEGAAP